MKKKPQLDTPNNRQVEVTTLTGSPDRILIIDDYVIVLRRGCKPLLFTSDKTKDLP